MKKATLLIFAVLGFLGIIACKGMKANQNFSSTGVENMTVTGKIYLIENGKDGYTAHIKDAIGKSYSATISSVNLLKNGKTFKRYETDQVITITGPVWTDTKGKIYMTVKEIQ